MRKVKGKNTAPEIRLRKMLWKWGYRGYRLYRRDLPGRPDVAFVSRKKAIFLHGCFWHGHICRAGLNRPKSNLDYWEPKLERNRTRDRANLSKLKELGWSALVIWECELKDAESVRTRVSEFLCA